MKSEDLMRVLAVVTGWGECLSVKTKYSRQQFVDGCGEVEPGDWIWIVSTTVCGTGVSSSATGKTHPQALYALVKQIGKDAATAASSEQQRARAIGIKIEEMLEDTDE